MIQLKELPKPKIPIIKMNCDELIDKKLTEFPMIEDCFSTNNFTIICGKQGQGKTALVVGMITSVFKKCYEKIYIIMPDVSRMSIKNDLFTKHLPPEQMFNDLTAENLNAINAHLQENSFFGENSLVLIDDFQQRFKNPDINLAMEEFMNKVRHLRTSVFLLQQNFQKLPKALREKAFNIICFNLGKSQLEKIFDEVLNMKRDVYNNLIDFCFDKGAKNKHNWICINLQNSKKIYKGFDEILF
jgi:hypothetical protein